MDLLSLSLQLLVVITPDWNSVNGTLYRYERNSIDDAWQLINPPISVVVGKHGLAWSQSTKKEGDNKSPAGIFTLGTAFGNASHAHHCRHMSFLLIEEGLEAVDDPQSIYYNQFVRRHHITTPDWKSSEVMSHVGFQYDLGLVINHNTSPVQPGKGSCIFIHIWSSPHSGTAGCTAMSEQNMIELLSWLDPNKHPHLIQFPIEEAGTLTTIANFPHNLRP